MDLKYKIALVYFCLISFASVLICVSDKRRAVKGRRRISERTLFLFCLAGGGAAMYAAMLAIRHKTRHKRFMFGIPAVIAAQIALILFFILK